MQILQSCIQIARLPDWKIQYGILPGMGSIWHPHPTPPPNEWMHEFMNCFFFKSSWKTCWNQLVWTRCKWVSPHVWKNLSDPSTKGGGLRPPPQRGAPPLCGILYGWVCGGWTGSKHSKTLRLAKARFGLGWKGACVGAKLIAKSLPMRRTMINLTFHEMPPKLLAQIWAFILTHRRPKFDQKSRHKLHDIFSSDKIAITESSTLERSRHRTQNDFR